MMPMKRFKNSLLLALALAAGLGACGAQSECNQADPSEPRPKLGLMTSLPIYWPLGTEIGEFASGEFETPWQREVFEGKFELVPLDTLSPVADLHVEAPPIDPLAEIDRLAVIQPRVLTPSDNVALDDWVRGGGRLLLVLDPVLGGHYPLPLGDPRHPVEAALIPPVLERWGLDLRFDEDQLAIREVTIADTKFPLVLTGSLREVAGASGQCRIMGEGVLARCRLGKGLATLLADAEIFKSSHQVGVDDGHSHGHEDGHEQEARIPAIQVLVELAFE
ncbi:hypothetical protein [uncultured Erythrobacter sp.]|uniref:hypothetical protein n=1 Tax=uncultured Erythrobacter sp. TaxID=263913 RepID=UPI0026246A6D|nr:hypothetical protein [uncultured Erythrobacter sp.]